MMELSTCNGNALRSFCIEFSD